MLTGATFGLGGGATARGVAVTVAARGGGGARLGGGHARQDRQDLRRAPVALPQEQGPKLRPQPALIDGEDELVKPRARGLVLGGGEVLHEVSAPRLTLEEAAQLGRAEELGEEGNKRSVNQRHSRLHRPTILPHRRAGGRWPYAPPPGDRH
ncbi:MAG: hypothetical protein IPN01_22865 [Deltaproteobacteria bacterium]|nr:hypothetical protein [Deltaproteobacteria bacterium]